MDRSRVNIDPISPAWKQGLPGQPPSSESSPTGMGATPVDPPGFEANRSDALAPGTKLEGYEIERVIGASGFGFVYLAYDPAAQHRVAIKEYMPDTLAVRDEDGVQVLVRADSHIEAFDRGRNAFIDEAQLLARCEHPSLLHVTRSWQSKGTAYRVMPYYAGNSLYTLREAMDAPADEASLRALLDGLLGALETLHEAGVTHREVSPWNILLLPDDTPILLDLSTARRAMVGDRARALMSLLTPSFAPIELMNLTPERPIGPWTDIHALGAVVRYCISGEMPRPATTALVRESMGAMVRRLQVTYPSLHYSPSFLTAIDAALEENPEDRPQSIQEFRKRLDDHPNAVMSRGDEEFEPMEDPAEDVDDDAARAPFYVRPEAETAAENAAVAESVHADVGAPAGNEPFMSVLAPTPPAESRRFEPVSLGAGVGQDPHGHFDAHADEHPAAFDFAKRNRRNRRRMATGCAALVLAALGTGAWWVDRQRNESAAQSAFEQAVKRDVGVKPADDRKVLEEVAQTAPIPVPALAASQVAAPALAAEPTRALASDAKLTAASPAASALAPPVTPPPATMAPARTRQAPAAAFSAGTASVKAPSKDSVPGKAAKLHSAAPAAKPSIGPREACGKRTEFSLYRCMKTQCAQAQWATHQSCKRLKERDEVG